MPRALEGSEKEQEGEKSHYYVGLGFVCCFQQTWPVLWRAQQTKHHVTWPALRGWGWRGAGATVCRDRAGWPCEPDVSKLQLSTLQQRPFGWGSRVPVRGRSGSCLSLQTAAFSPGPPVAVPSVYVCVLICFSYEDASHSQLRPAHVNSVYLNCLFEGHTSKLSHRLGCWGKDICP